jgi:hypothetical protein
MNYICHVSVWHIFVFLWEFFPYYEGKVYVFTYI